MSIYLDDRCPTEKPSFLNLADDLMVMPIQGNDGESICHSASTGKWYVIRNHDNPVIVGKEKYWFGCADFGSWLDISNWFDKKFHAFAPFNFGETFPGKILPDRVKYLPIWEEVPNGAEVETDDGCTYQPTKDIYKIIKICPYPKNFAPADNPIQNNYDTSFEVFDYGDDLPEMVKDLQRFTGKEF